MKVAEFIMARLVWHGVVQAYCVTGGAAMHLNDALGAEPGIRVRYLHHEQACAIAAEGYARVAGIPALVQVTAGPGAINAMNGVFGAFTDSIPMIVVSGQVRSDTLAPRMGPEGLRQLGDQELRTLDAVRPMTKWAVQLHLGDDLSATVDEAVRIATTGRPGPVWLDVPVDVQGSLTEADPRASARPNSAISGAGVGAHAETIVGAISRAARPIILAGTGVRLADRQEELVEFAELLEVPVATAWTHDIFPSNHRLYAGRPGTIGTRAGNFAVQAADLIVVLGSRLNIRQVSYNWDAFAEHAEVIHVDIDAAELDKHYLRSTNRIESDLRDLLPALVSEARTASTSTHQEWTRWIREVRSSHEPREEDYPVRESGVNAYHFVMELARLITSEHVVVSGDATACIVPFQVLSLPWGSRLFSNSGCASMGYDLPAAIGSSDAAPSRPIWCLAGDGSVMMNLQELQSLSVLDRDIVLFILANDGYLSIKQTQRNFFGRDFGSSPESGVTFPDFARVANAFDLPVTELFQGPDWRASLATVVSGIGPRVCVVHLDREQEFEPRLRSKMTAEGIRTPALDDMYPHLAESALAAVRQSAVDCAPGM